MITFQKSLAAALLTGTIAFATPVLLHAQTAAGKAGGSATTSGQVQVPASNGASQAAGANAAGAASTINGANGNVTPNSTPTTTGTYGGMGTDQTTINRNKAKNKATTPTNSMSSPNNMAPPPH
jgi:hypothetical protein